MTKRVAVVVALLFVAACGKATPKATPTPTATPVPTRPAVTTGQSNRPLAGVYTYTLTSTKGTKIAAGFEEIETLAVAGERYTWMLTTNQNSNHVTLTRGWSSTGMVLAAADSVAGTGERKCAYNPPPRVVPLPLKVEKLPTQTYSNPDLACSGSKDVSVTGQETVNDGKGRSWPTWKIEETTTEGGATVTQNHWFSPTLGVDIRDENVSAAQTLLSVLSDYPS